jgi:hypothetical protein
MTTPAIVGDPSTIPVGAQVSQVCPAIGRGATVVVYNNDLVNVAYAGYRNTIGVSNSVPIQPLASATLDASRSLYAFCPTATVQLSIAPGGTNIQPSPAQIAAQIAAAGLATAVNQVAQETAIPANISTTGVPLLVAPGLLNKATGSVVTHGSQLNTGSLAFNQPAYDIVIEAEIAAGSTQSWLMVTLEWVDSNTSFSVFEEIFILAVTSNGVNLVGGRGQTKGDLLNVVFQNLDTAESITLSYSIVQHSRIPPFTDWRQLGFNGISAPALTTPSYDVYSNILFSESVSVGGASNISYIVPLFTGNVFWTVGQVVASSARIALRVPAEPVSGGTIAANNTVFDSGALAANAAFTQLVAMPRQNCQLEILNTNAAAQTISVAALIADY